jgi:hypothetical protein
VHFLLLKEQIGAQISRKFGLESGRRTDRHASLCLSLVPQPCPPRVRAVFAPIPRLTITTPHPSAATWANVGASRGLRLARAVRGIARRPLTPRLDRGHDPPGISGVPFSATKRLLST